VRVRVKGGDTLSAIARRHSVSVEDLRAWNRLGPRGQLRKGQELVVQMVD
jgi:LysM repeat protein